MHDADGIPICVPPDPNPHAPSFEVPPGSVDTHSHIFGPVDTYEYIPGRGYTPPDASIDAYHQMHAALGIDRGVLTQPSVYGTDNRAQLDAVQAMPERTRVVVAVDLSVTDDELAALDAAGARGVRLNLANKGGMPIALEDIATMADRVVDLGWHLEFLLHGEDFLELRPYLTELSTDLVFGHMAYMPVDPGVDHPGFQSLLDLVREGRTWVKLSAPNRLSKQERPPYADVDPLGRAFVETMPQRMLWATDWPHPDRFGFQPNDGDLLEQLAAWAPDPDVRRTILVDNPVALYRF